MELVGSLLDGRRCAATVDADKWSTRGLVWAVLLLCGVCSLIYTKSAVISQE